MKCTEIFNKTQSTAMVLLVCGLVTSLQSIFFTNSIITFFLGIGTKQPAVKTVSRKESEWETQLPPHWLKKLLVSKSPNGDGYLMIFIRLGEDCLQAWVIQMMFEQCTYQHATESTGMWNTTGIKSVKKKRQWSKDDSL